MRQQKRFILVAKRIPKLAVLSVLLIGTMLLDALAYGLANSCSSCTSYLQFLTTSTSTSAPILASISSMVSLTNKGK